MAVVKNPDFVALDVNVETVQNLPVQQPVKSESEGEVKKVIHTQMIHP